MKSRPLEPVTPVITVQELSDWLSGVDVADPLLLFVCESATDAVIEYLQLELVDRAREVVYSQWPTSGTPACGLSPCNDQYDMTAILPYAGLQEVIKVELFGDEITEYQVKQSTPSQIRFNAIPAHGIANYDAIKIEYIAGFGVVADVPSGIKLAVRNLAAYLYDQRGACGMDDALNMSGAKEVLRTYKTNLAVF